MPATRGMLQTRSRLGTLTRPRAVGTGRWDGLLGSMHVHATFKARRDLIVQAQTGKEQRDTAGSTSVRRDQGTVGRLTTGGGRRAGAGRSGGGPRAVLRPEAASREDREPEHGRERRPAEGKAGSRQEPAKWPEPERREEERERQACWEESRPPVGSDSDGGRGEHPTEPPTPRTSEPPSSAPKPLPNCSSQGSAAKPGSGFDVASHPPPQPRLDSRSFLKID